MKYVIISNRLPITVVEQSNGFAFTRSGGGLATGLDSLETPLERHWIGWPGLHVDEEEAREKITAQLRVQSLHPVYLSPEHIHNYYEGYSNSTLWPLCHYFFSYIEREDTYWEAYKEVNELFCQKALTVIEPGDLVWIHDYQLMLLPGMLRAHMPNLGIGYFHHIPFPSYELFRYLPERVELLQGLLGADLIGFHVHDYMRHFISCLFRVLHKTCQLDQVEVEGRVAEIEAFPMGINYELYHEGPTTPEALAFAEELHSLAGDSKIILSIDRLDYSKGILLRLKSFTDFLEDNPDYRGKVTLLMVVVPSRDNVEMYAELKTKIDEMIGAINGAYAAVGWTPVHYFYRSFSFAELSAMYNKAAIALVTPLRDGMNLVAKEFLAAKRDQPGVLILSEMAGAAVELPEAIIINPTNSEQIKEALLQALNMPEEEQLASLQKMQKHLARQDVRHWAKDFLSELEVVRERNKGLREKLLEGEKQTAVRKAYAAAQKRLLVLDYDGTLTPIVRNPAMAFPSQKLRETLFALSTDARNMVVICSGRDMQTLERWLGDLDVGLSAEHGAFYKEGETWVERRQSIEWGDEIMGLLERVTDKTPRSRIETKRTALVWHYREVDPWVADLRVPQLVNALVKPCTQLGLQIVHGKKIVEVKPADYNKGTEIKRLLEQDSYDFVLAMGDDTTDEDMFIALPESAITIKIGPFSDTARYFLTDQPEVLPFLSELASSGT